MISIYFIFHLFIYLFSLLYTLLASKPTWKQRIFRTVSTRSTVAATSHYLCTPHVLSVPCFTAVHSRFAFVFLRTFYFGFAFDTFFLPSNANYFLHILLWLHSMCAFHGVPTSHLRIFHGKLLLFSDFSSLLHFVFFTADWRCFYARALVVAFCQGFALFVWWNLQFAFDFQWFYLHILFIASLRSVTCEG